MKSIGAMMGAEILLTGRTEYDAETWRPCALSLMAKSGFGRGLRPFTSSRCPTPSPPRSRRCRHWSLTAGRHPRLGGARRHRVDDVALSEGWGISGATESVSAQSGVPESGRCG